MKKIISLLLLIIASCAPTSYEFTEQELYAQWDSLPHSYPEPYVTVMEKGYSTWVYIYQDRLDKYNNYRTYNSQHMTFQQYMDYMLGK